MSYVTLLKELKKWVMVLEQVKFGIMNYKCTIESDMTKLHLERIKYSYEKLIEIIIINKS